MQRLDITVGEGLNVDSNVVVEGSLIFNVTLDSYLSDRMVDCCIAWVGKNSIVHVYNEYDFVSAEHTVIHPGLPESNLFYPSSEVMVTHLISLSLSIYILEDLEEVRCPAYPLGIYYLGNLHVHVKFNVSLSKGEYKVHLACAPYIDDRQDYYQYDGESSHNRLESLEEIRGVFLFTTLYVETRLVFEHLIVIVVSILFE